MVGRLRHHNFRGRWRVDQLRRYCRESRAAPQYHVQHLRERTTAHWYVTQYHISVVQKRGSRICAGLRSVSETFGLSGIQASANIIPERVRTLRYSVPDGLHHYIDMIQPTTRFGQVRPQISHVLETTLLGNASDRIDISNSTGCENSIIPACLKDLYNISGYSPSNDTGFAAFNNFLEQYPRYSDLETFAAAYATYAVGVHPTWSSINGGLLTQNDTVDASFEASLDVGQHLLHHQKLLRAVASVCSR